MSTPNPGINPLDLLGGLVELFGGDSEGGSPFDSLFGGGEPREQRKESAPRSPSATRVATDIFTAGSTMKDFVKANIPTGPKRDTSSTGTIDGARISAAAANLAASRGWTRDYATGIVNELVASLGLTVATEKVPAAPTAAPAPKAAPVSVPVEDAQEVAPPVEPEPVVEPEVVSVDNPVPELSAEALAAIAEYLKKAGKL